MDTADDTLTATLDRVAATLRRVARDGDGLPVSEQVGLLVHRHAARPVAPRHTASTRTPAGPAATIDDEQFRSAVELVVCGADESRGWRLLVELTAEADQAHRTAAGAPVELAAAQHQVAEVQEAATVAADRAAQAAHDLARARDAADAARGTDDQAAAVARVQMAERQHAVAGQALAQARHHHDVADRQPLTAQEHLQARWEHVLLRQLARTVEQRAHAVAAAMAAHRHARPPLRALPHPGPVWRAVTDLLDRAGSPLPTRLAGPLVAAQAGVPVPPDRWGGLARDARVATRRGEHAFVRVDAPDGSAWPAWVALDDQPPPDDVAAAVTIVAMAASTGLHGADPDGYLPVAREAVAAVDPCAPDDLAGLVAWAGRQGLVP